MYGFALGALCRHGLRPVLGAVGLTDGAASHRSPWRRWAHACAIALAAVAFGGCATRPVNPPIENADPHAGYRAEGREIHGAASDTMIILAFSGGGTRAAAFSYGVLEELRRTEFTVDGQKTRMLDEVDVITGVSGGSFTALAYGLYGDKLFDEYEHRFLKRDVQGELFSRFINPGTWPSLWSIGYGRSDMAATLYDEILFNGATFADLMKKPGPIVIASATDLSTGSRLAFVQGDWDLICSDLSAVRLSRAAAASSAVPLVLSPVTINNYGGSCKYQYPPWVGSIADPKKRSRPAGRALQRYTEMQSFQDSVTRPYLHLVDGGVSDNLGMRAVIEWLEELESSQRQRRASKLDGVKRIVVFVVNSLSVPKTNWDQSENPPNDLEILVKATGVPIDRYSYEAVELLKDLMARWKLLRELKTGEAFANGGNLTLARAVDVPDIELFAIDVSFAANSDPAERAYLNDLPTSFVLPDDAVDRLRTAAATAIQQSPDYKRLIDELSKSPQQSNAAQAAQ